jgi:hypothetical protein
MPKTFTSWLFISQILMISHITQAVVNQIDMRNVPGYNLQPACSQDCLYCCHDVAFQSSCFSNECFCNAGSFSDRLRYVEYCAYVQCQGNISAIVSATSIVKNYCSNSLWTTAFAYDPNAATAPTAPPEITVPATFTFQAGIAITSSQTVSQATPSQAGGPVMPTVYLGGTSPAATVTQTVVKGAASTLTLDYWQAGSRGFIGLVIAMIWSSLMS